MRGVGLRGRGGGCWCRGCVHVWDVAATAVGACGVLVEKHCAGCAKRRSGGGASRAVEEFAEFFEAVELGFGEENIDASCVLFSGHMGGTSMFPYYCCYSNRTS